MEADEGSDQMQVDVAVLEYCVFNFLIICNKFPFFHRLAKWLLVRV